MILKYKSPKHVGLGINSIFLVEFSVNIGRNGFLTSIASKKIFRPYFQKSKLEYYFLCLFYFSSPYSGHLRSDFVVLLLLLTARSRRTRKADQKCPEKQDKKSKRDMKNKFLEIKNRFHMNSPDVLAIFCVSITSTTSSQHSLDICLLRSVACNIEYLHFGFWGSRTQPCP